MVNFAVVVVFSAVFLPITLTVGVVPGECTYNIYTHCILDNIQCYNRYALTQICIRNWREAIKSCFKNTILF